MGVDIASSVGDTHCRRYHTECTDLTTLDASTSREMRCQVAMDLIRSSLLILSSCATSLPSKASPGYSASPASRGGSNRPAGALLVSSSEPPAAALTLTHGASQFTGLSLGQNGRSMGSTCHSRHAARQDGRACPLDEESLGSTRCTRQPSRWPRVQERRHFPSSSSSSPAQSRRRRKMDFSCDV
jgi:hypothetical protein